MALYVKTSDLGKKDINKFRVQAIAMGASLAPKLTLALALVSLNTEGSGARAARGRPAKSHPALLATPVYSNKRSKCYRIEVSNSYSTSSFGRKDA